MKRKVGKTTKGGKNLTKLELAKDAIGKYRIENDWYYCILHKRNKESVNKFDVFFNKGGVIIADEEDGEYNILCVGGLSDEEFEQLEEWTRAVDVAVDNALKTALLNS